MNREELRMQHYEKLGSFYLGRLWDADKVAPREDLLLYDSKDLTTHAVCVGMTGSGKTGLCISLLEEAALDGIPAIAVDPKGDLGNLLLTFPELRGSDFRPWVDESEAARTGVSPDEYAARTAETWRKGLADWGQDPSRIVRLREAADVAIYTPGSGAGLPLTVLKSFAAPPAALRDDADAMRDRVMASASGVLALLGIDADPLKSREHILLSSLLGAAWREGKNLGVADLVRQIQAPPFDRIGVLDVESFYPAKERAGLAMALNGLLASPGFAAWLEGEPLDVAKLLWTSAGKPRLSVLSIAHLGEAERMFFVTILLEEIVGWMRAQPGTPSLRAILYMDEVFGYFPPTANPPSKRPMLTLLKQARAYGLGVVLATQNPVDLDYKGLSNAGTWFLGRLQTERDKMRVIEGLEGASAAAGASFDRQEMEATLAGLGNRVFLMNNVHEDQPVLFQSRWALSYLRGPLTKTQIRSLMAARKVPPAEVSVTKTAAPQAAAGDRPVVPAEADEAFLPWRGASPERLVYHPALLGTGRVHYVSAKAGVDLWEDVTLLAPLPEEGSDDPWAQAVAPAVEATEIEGRPDDRLRFASLPPSAARPKSYASWSKALVDSLYRSRALAVWTCRELEQNSKAGETEGEFRARLSLAMRERRDDQVGALRKRYAPKLQGLRERIRKAEERVAREQSQYQQQNVQTAISVGATLLGALFGRKKAGVGAIGRATTAARGVGRSMREKEDIGAAQESVESLNAQLVDLERELEEETATLQDALDPVTVALEKTEVRPRRSDLSVTKLRLVWVPRE
jgi:hypothetical protein